MIGLQKHKRISSTIQLPTSKSNLLDTPSLCKNAAKIINIFPNLLVSLVLIFVDFELFPKSNEGFFEISCFFK